MSQRDVSDGSGVKRQMRAGVYSEEMTLLPSQLHGGVWSWNCFSVCKPGATQVMCSIRCFSSTSRSSNSLTRNKQAARKRELWPGSGCLWLGPHRLWVERHPLKALMELLVGSGVKAEEKSRENMHLTGTENTALRWQSGWFRGGFWHLMWRSEACLLGSGPERLAWFPWQCSHCCRLPVPLEMLWKWVGCECCLRLSSFWHLVSTWPLLPWRKSPSPHHCAFILIWQASYLTKHFPKCLSLFLIFFFLSALGLCCWVGSSLVSLHGAAP